MRDPRQRPSAGQLVAILNNLIANMAASLTYVEIAASASGAS